MHGTAALLSVGADAKCVHGVAMEDSVHAAVPAGLLAAWVVMLWGVSVRLGRGVLQRLTSITWPWQWMATRRAVLSGRHENEDKPSVFIISYGYQRAHWQTTWHGA